MNTKLIEAGLSQIWANLQTMDDKERKKLIKKVISMNDKNCSFIDYAAKPFLINLIKKSECYFNDTGTTTPVKEFQDAGL